MPSCIEKLRATYGDRVQDAFAGTKLAQEAARLKFGLYVIRGAYKEDVAKQAMEDVAELLKNMSKSKGPRSVQAKGSKLLYPTLQATSGVCTCQYDCAKIARHVPHKIKDAPLLERMTDFVNAEVGDGREQFLNQILVNVYNWDRDEHLPWHSDEDSLYCAIVTASCMLKPLALVFSIN